MSEFSLEKVYGGNVLGGAEYKEETGELFLGHGRIVKRIHIRTSTSSVLSLRTEEKIVQISVDGDLLLALDALGRVYLHSLFYDTEVGRMLSKGCRAAIVKDGKIYLEHAGYLQEWIVENNGFFAFNKTKHITGHRDTITQIWRTEEGMLTSGYDCTLRHYSIDGNKSKHVRSSKAQAVSAKKIGEEIVAVWSNGEVSRHAQEEEGWEASMRKYTMLNLLSADISQMGDMVVAVDTSHNVLLFSARTESPEPLHKLFVSEHITHAQFVEGDEWIVLTGNGVVIWEWRANILLFDEQSSASQVCAHETSSALITGTETGDIFLWDKQLSTCSKKITEHSSSVVGIVPTSRGFISASRNGVCKVHKHTGEVTKAIETETCTSVIDADDDLLAVAGPRHLGLYDVKRSKKISSSEIGFPLSVKIVGNSVVVVCMEVLFVVSSESTLTKDMPEPCTAGSVAVFGGSARIVCIGESGMIYVYNSELEEIEEFRGLPKYANGAGKATPLSIVMSEDKSVLLTYRLIKPDRHTSTRTSLCASVFQNGYEVDTWTVLEREESGSGQIFVSHAEHGVCVGVCTSSGVLVFSDKKKGFKPQHLWQKETPEDIQKHIEEGNPLLGAIGAVRLQSVPLMKLAIEAGDAEVLGKYFPAELLSSFFPLIVSLISEGLVEKPLAILKEALKRVSAPALLGRQLFLALNQSFEISVSTTGYADALLRYPSLSKKEAKEASTLADMQ
ncbi:hypothetical protein NECID01_0401 [Nematocida sp. AWRm77]|nr:hypothetical protein NECID01_0401 [Nematocida sp. AWRm77]